MDEVVKCEMYSTAQIPVHNSTCALKDSHTIPNTTVATTHLRLVAFLNVVCAYCYFTRLCEPAIGLAASVLRLHKYLGFRDRCYW